MEERTCGWCGVDISQLKSVAQYCSTQHKKNAASKRHRDRNPGYYKRYHGSPARVAWLEANRERVRAYAREHQAQYRAEHPEHAAAWWAANPVKHRLYQAQRRARKTANGEYSVTERDIRRLLLRWNNCCAYCGNKPDGAPLHLDHIVPLKRGGQHSIGNLIPACQRCNTSKNARLLYPWRTSVLLTEYARSLQAG